MDDINYQLNSSIYVANGCHYYVALIKTDIQLTALDGLVHCTSKEGDPVNRSHANDL